MKLRTGLIPSVQRVHVSADHSTHPGTTTVRGHSMNVPDDAVWEVTLTEPRAEVSEHVLLLNTEPKIQHRQVKMPVIDTAIPGHEERYEERYDELRKAHNIPDDAVVQDHWVGNYTLKERVATWYEITT